MARCREHPRQSQRAWVLRGTRTPVKILFETLETRLSIDEVIKQFPMTREQPDSLMAFVTRSLEKEERRALSAHTEGGYLQSGRGELIDGEQARREIKPMKDEMW
jgi:uncharacterized protein (DUF433 family)